MPRVFLINIYKLSYMNLTELKHKSPSEILEIAYKDLNAIRASIDTAEVAVDEAYDEWRKYTIAAISASAFRTSG